MPSTLSSLKLELESTCQDASSLTWNQLSLMKLELVPIDNSSTQNNLFLERKMLLTTLPEVTIPLVRKSQISVWIESESQLTNALVSKVSQSSTQSVVELDLVWDLYFWKDFPLITVRSQSSDSLSILHLKYPLLWLNHTTLYSQPTLYWNTLMSLLCLITKPFTISAEETSILKDQPTPTLTD